MKTNHQPMKPRKKRGSRQQHVSLSGAPHNEVQEEIYKLQSEMRKEEYARHEAAVREILEKRRAK